MKRTLPFTAVMFVLALVAGCNTTPVTRSSGAPSAPGVPSTGSSAPSAPSVQVQAPGLPGLPAPGSAPAAGATPGAPAPGTISLPTPQPGTTAAGSTGARTPTPTGTQPQPPEAKPAGAGGREQTEDEILAAALQALERRPDAAGQGATGAEPGSAGAGSPAMTDVERKQALGKQLQQGFAEFDRVMLSEQQANNERADQEGGGYGEDEALAAADTTSGGAAGEPLQTALVDSDPIAIKGEGNISTPSHSQVPPDLADARDDDIIARQLREAAMKEQDPELREKLWDEYRKYKRDSR